MLAREKILEAAGRAAALKAGTFCLVISGRAPGERVFGKVLDVVREIRARHDLKVCACLGLLNADQATRLADAGVETVNHNLNTSERFHPGCLHDPHVRRPGRDRGACQSRRHQDMLGRNHWHGRVGR